MLAEWHLTTDYFDGSTVSGPVPRFFALNPEEAREAMSRDPAKVFKDLQRIYARLFVSNTYRTAKRGLTWATPGNNVRFLKQ